MDDNININLLVASIRGNLEDVKRSLEQGANINYIDESKRTALMDALVNKHFEIARELLRCGANPDIQNKDGWTALHTASYWNRSLEIVRELLINGADPNLRDDKGRTFLDHIEDPEKKREIEEFTESLQGVYIKG